MTDLTNFGDFSDFSDFGDVGDVGGAAHLADKTAARTRYRRLRESLDPARRAAIDAAIDAEVIALPAFSTAELVFSYLSVGEEVDTLQLVRAAWDAGKAVAVPRCVACGRMAWHRIDGFDGLVSGAFGIPEPPDEAATAVEAPAEPGAPAIAFVPGYAFDLRGYRLGYGGGYYDRFLPTFGGTSVGLCRTCQFSTDPLPHDPHDVAVDIVVTETGALELRL